MRGPGRVGRKPHREEPPDHGQVAHAVEKEAHSHAPGADQDARERRPEHAGGVEERRVERDRAQQVFLPHHLHEERLARGDVEGVHDPEQCGERDHPPDRHGLRPHQHRERERLEHLQRLREHHGAAFVHAVGHDARVQREQQHTERADRRDEADVERGVGELQDQPALGHRLHPRARKRDGLAEEEEAEVAMREGTKRSAAGSLGHCGKARGAPIFGVERRCVTPPTVATCPS